MDECPQNFFLHLTRSVIQGIADVCPLEFLHDNGFILLRKVNSDFLIAQGFDFSHFPVEVIFIEG